MTVKPELLLARMLRAVREDRGITGVAVSMAAGLARNAACTAETSGRHLSEATVEALAVGMGFKSVLDLYVVGAALLLLEREGEAAASILRALADRMAAMAAERMEQRCASRPTPATP